MLPDYVSSALVVRVLEYLSVTNTSLLYVGFKYLFVLPVITITHEHFVAESPQTAVFILHHVCYLGVTTLQGSVDIYNL